jgi:hypothetical protein
VRKAAAKALKALYYSGTLSDMDKSRILSKRDVMAEKHLDVPGCNLPGSYHTDNGIEVDL